MVISDYISFNITQGVLAFRGMENIRGGIAARSKSAVGQIWTWTKKTAQKTFAAMSFSLFSFLKKKLLVVMVSINFF